MEDPEQTFPRARGEPLLTCDVAGELLIYDPDDCRAHCLNSTAAFIWRQCDGQTSVSEITRALNSARAIMLDDSVVWFALEGLEQANLIHTMQRGRAATAKLTRRGLIKKAGAMVALGWPLINSIVAPSAAEAASCRPPGAACGPNGPNGTCCSGTCVLGLCA